jgi:hypothetical protein
MHRNPVLSEYIRLRCWDGLTLGPSGSVLDLVLLQVTGVWKQLYKHNLFDAA